MRMTSRCALSTALLLFGVAPAWAYPLDGFDSTRIGRLKEAQLIQSGERPGTKQPKGALWPLAEVDVRLQDREFALPAPDPAFSAAVAALLGDKVDRYNIALLDLTDPDAPAYVEHNAGELRNPGSVGKLLVVLAWFQALADLYPDDVDARRRILVETELVADDVVLTDHHTVRNFDPDTGVLTRRSLRPGDRGSLYEYMDWMISASSNSAAAQLMKELVALVHFGKRYPVSAEEHAAFFRDTPKSELGRIMMAAMQEPVPRNGLDLAEFRQGSLFTATGKRRIPGTSSHGNARALLKYLLLMEQGKLVDAYSSREIKRLMYQTERRIRYASSPALAGSAVYFKSGSLFRCKAEPEFTCRPYQGNVINFMNSAAAVEVDVDGKRIHYLLGLMSNVLRRNSAVDHQALATRIHQLILKRHASGTPSR